MARNVVPLPSDHYKLAISHAPPTALRNHAMPKQFVKWVTAAVGNLIDPERDDRVKALAGSLSRGLKEEQKAFSISRFKAQHQHHPRELADAVQLVFRRLLERLWNDQLLTEKENLQLDWVQKCLEIPASETAALRTEFATAHFRTALAQAMQDGQLSHAEEVRLQQIAQSAGESITEFSRRFFRKEGESFLRRIFDASVEDGSLTHEEWQTLLSTSQRLGITADELLQAIARPATEFVEHVLTDARSESTITAEQEATINWLMTTLRIAPQVADYAREELGVLRCLHEIQAGRLPSLPKPDGLEFRSGELVHGVKQATLIVVRHLSSGPQQTQHTGRLVLMDSRMVFQSATFAQSFNYRRIVSHRGGPDWIEFQIEQKPVWGLRLNSADPLLYQILHKAIALSNQTASRQGGTGNTRHIPRDVRQRVWTRDGGKCVDCNATEYLEYDHIIPVAKGGSNEETNVQILCRRCNLKKSDHI